jgi:hypothetical protein
MPKVKANKITEWGWQQSTRTLSHLYRCTAVGQNGRLPKNRGRRVTSDG